MNIFKWFSNPTPSPEPKEKTYLELFIEKNQDWNPDPTDKPAKTSLELYLERSEEDRERDARTYRALYGAGSALQEIN